MRSNIDEKNTIVVVIDLECNQPSSAIIELGYAIGDLATGEINLKKSIVINPKEELAESIIELTGISQKQVDQGTTLQHAYDEFLKDVRQAKALTIIHQWGIWDAQLLKNQLNDPEAWKFGRRWIDIKAIAQTSAIINKQSPIAGLAKVCGRFELDIDKKKAHSAGYDADMTFQLYVKLAGMLKKQ